MSEHAPRKSWPHTELHRRPQWQDSQGGLGRLWHSPHEDRGPIGSYTEGPSSRVHMVASGDVNASALRGSTPRRPQLHPSHGALRVMKRVSPAALAAACGW
eukprot:7770416-Pyramimonas_sp.AAC.1